MTDISVRPYRDADFDAIAALHDRARRDELRDGGVAEEAFLPLVSTYEGEGLFDGDVWVAESDGAVVGFVAADPGEITWLYVDPDHYRRGVGRRLIDTALATAGDSVEVTVLAGNSPAITAYERAGFRIVDTRSGRLVGNEAFPATGHIMVRRADAAAATSDAPAP